MLYPIITEVKDVKIGNINMQYSKLIFFNTYIFNYQKFYSWF